MSFEKFFRAAILQNMAALRSKKEIEPGNDMLNFTQNGSGITSITDKLEHVSI